MVHINRYIERPIFWVVLVGVIWLVGNPSTSALEINLERPGDREFVRDLVDMIDSAAEDHIKHLCNRLLNDKATPIIAITIGSMERYAGRGMRIETFTKLLFDQWQVGHSKLDHQDWNTGILLLVSRGDRQARIELGAGWGHKQDALCRQIMDNHIIYHF